MDIVTCLPFDLSERILSLYHTLYIHPLIVSFDRTSWMWRCSQDRLELSTSRGSIQIGYCEDYDGWAKVYRGESCEICDYSRQVCDRCVQRYRENIRNE